MQKRKPNTMRSLTLSIISIIMCMIMLVGTTFAWFVDQVDSGLNTIISGVLDVGLTHTSATVTVPTDVEGAENLFSVNRWEPGVMTYENFKISNLGDLAFKYKFSMNIAEYNTYTEGGNVYSLLDVLKVAVIKGSSFEGDRNLARSYFDGTEREGVTVDYLKNIVFEDVLLANVTGAEASANAEPNSYKKGDEEFAVIIYWQPTATDSIYNMNNNKTVSHTMNGMNRLGVKLGVHLVATQFTFENDYFDEDYDRLAVGELGDHVWEVQSDGSFKCLTCSAHETLQYTDHAYIATVDAKGQPVDVISLAGADFPSAPIGTGYIVKDNNVLTYTNSDAAQKVVIRTESFITTLNVNAPEGTVAHYGPAAYVNVEAVAGNSYHEFGTVGRLYAKQGKVETESTAEVFCLMVDEENVVVNEHEDSVVHKEVENIKVEETGVTKDQTTGVANGKVLDCGDGNHSFSKLVIDSAHVYDVCTTCGYTLITVNGEKETVAENGDSENAITPIGEIVDTENPITEEQVTCDHQFNEEVVGNNVVATCTKCGLSYMHAVEQTLIGGNCVVDHPEYLVGVWCNYCHHIIPFVEGPFDKELVETLPTEWFDEFGNQHYQAINYPITYPDNNGNSVAVPLQYMYLGQATVDEYGVNITLPAGFDNTVSPAVLYVFKSFPDGGDGYNYADELTYREETDAKGRITYVEDPTGGYTKQSIVAKYSDYKVDYTIEFDSDIEQGSCGIVGSYESMAFGVDLPAMKAGDSIGLLSFMGTWTYSRIIQNVRNFVCGFYNLDESNIGKNIIVKLKMTNPDDPTDIVTCSTVVYHITEKSYPAYHPTHPEFNAQGSN